MDDQAPNLPNPPSRSKGRTGRVVLTQLDAARLRYISEQLIEYENMPRNTRRKYATSIQRILERAERTDAQLILG